MEKNQKFRIRMETKDGVLVAEPESDRSFYVGSNGVLNKEFTDYAIQARCRQAGVRMLSYTQVPTGLLVKVSWL